MAARMTRRAFLAGAAGLAGTFALAGCGGGTGSTSSDSSSDGGSSTESSTSSPTSSKLTEPLDNGYSSGTHHATLEVEGFGTIQLELYANQAPITVSNFCDLVQSGFYNGLTFHRIIKGFMVQGGDPKGDGTGGSGRTIKGEFSANGVSNVLQHKRGTISMARSSANDSASSQFFIMQEENSSLDGQYAAFGKVTEGIEVVDALCDLVAVQDSNGTVAAADQPKIASITMVD